MPSTHTEVYEIHRSFSDTEFGDKLADNVRYDKYRPDHILKKEWTELLGADVNNLTHMPLTYGLARAFINHTRVHQSDLMNESEEKLLLIAALSHDWAESITTDISFGDKTVLDDEEEQAAFERYLVSFYQGKDFELVDQARREIVFDHDSKLGEILNAIERIGYLRTALRADQLLRNGVGDSELRIDKPLPMPTAAPMPAPMPAAAAAAPAPMPAAPVEKRLTRLEKLRLESQKKAGGAPAAP